MWSDVSAEAPDVWGPAAMSQEEIGLFINYAWLAVTTHEQWHFKNMHAHT